MPPIDVHSSARGRPSNSATLETALELSAAKQLSLNAFKDRLLYIFCSIAISIAILLGGLSLLALGRNENSEARVFTASLVTLGGLGLLGSIVSLFRVSWNGFRGQYASAVMARTESHEACAETDTIVRKLDSLRHDSEFEQELLARVHSVEEDQLADEEKMADEVIGLVQHHIQRHKTDLHFAE